MGFESPGEGSECESVRDIHAAGGSTLEVAERLRRFGLGGWASASSHAEEHGIGREEDRVPELIERRAGRPGGAKRHGRDAKDHKRGQGQGQKKAPEAWSAQSRRGYLWQRIDRDNRRNSERRFIDCGR